MILRSLVFTAVAIGTVFIFSEIVKPMWAGTILLPSLRKRRRGILSVLKGGKPSEK